MKTIYFTLLAAFFALMGCNSQSQPNNHEKTPPKTDIKVTKEYDDKGNLIRYDSIYTWYYSTFDSDKEMIDSVMRNFSLRFNQSFPYSQSLFFNDYFRREFSDTSFFEDFFKDDFFNRRFRQDIQYMDRFFREMDSIKNRLFYDFYQQQSLRKVY